MDAYASLQDDRTIRVERAAENNLQHIDVDIPRDQLVVVTGVSGSGKSSLDFDTLHAEGQRRYLETFSAYARQFMGGLERPKVERITGLSPVIAIEQKTISRNPRSTVGTVTELLDFLRVLFARAATAYSSATGEPMVRFTDEGILSRIVEDYAGERLLLLAPLVRGRNRAAIGAPPRAAFDTPAASAQGRTRNSHPFPSRHPRRNNNRSTTLVFSPARSPYRSSHERTHRTNASPT